VLHHGPRDGVDGGKRHAWISMGDRRTVRLRDLPARAPGSLPLRIQRHPHSVASQKAHPPIRAPVWALRLLDALPEDRLGFVVQNQLRPEELKRALGTQWPARLAAQHRGPPKVVGAAFNRFRIGNPVTGLKHQHQSQLRRWHAGPSVIRAVEHRKILVAIKPVRRPGQLADEGRGVVAYPPSLPNRTCGYPAYGSSPS
jgi:hypothetical protein